MFLYSMTKLKC